MKTNLLARRFLVVAAVALLFARAANADTTLADLRQDWSLASNPNVGPYGTWSLNAGNTPLSQIPAWFGTQFSGWGPSANIGGDFLPFWFKTTAPSSDSQIGSVLVHSTDPFNGDGNGPANATWTSASSGQVTISGELWAPVINALRSNDYELVVNHGATQTVLASGIVLMDGSNSSANPITFSIANQTLAAGDVVELLVTEHAGSEAGFWTGVDLTISTAAVDTPEPTSLAMIAGFAAITGIAVVIRRRRMATGRSASEH